ncbi:MAG: hypothetical protein ACREGJ_04385 [Candidatus Saccharimonadales bacterium]
MEKHNPEQQEARTDLHDVTAETLRQLQELLASGQPFTTKVEGLHIEDAQKQASYAIHYNDCSYTRPSRHQTEVKQPATVREIQSTGEEIMFELWLPLVETTASARYSAAEITDPSESIRFWMKTEAPMPESTHEQVVEVLQEYLDGQKIMLGLSTDKLFDPRLQLHATAKDPLKHPVTVETTNAYRPTEPLHNTTVTGINICQAEDGVKIQILDDSWRHKQTDWVPFEDVAFELRERPDAAEYLMQYAAERFLALEQSGIEDTAATDTLMQQFRESLQLNEETYYVIATRDDKYAQPVAGLTETGSIAALANIYPPRYGQVYLQCDNIVHTAGKIWLVDTAAKIATPLTRAAFTKETDHYDDKIIKQLPEVTVRVQQN